MPKIDLAALPVRSGTIYPPDFAGAVDGRTWRPAGAAAGLTQFGANLVTLAPGAQSSIRHWHEAQDEFLVLLAGELVLIEDGGETAMAQGDCAAFPAGTPDGHCLVNRSQAEARFVVIGTHTATETVTYSDIDLKARQGPDGTRLMRKDGTPYRDPAQAKGSKR